MWGVNDVLSNYFKMKKTLLIVVAIFLYYHVDIYLRTINAAGISFRNCTTQIGTNNCTIDAINEKLKGPNQLITIDGKFIDIQTGEEKKPNLNVLHNAQRDVYIKNRKKIIAENSFAGVVFKKFNQFGVISMDFVASAIILLSTIVIIWFLIPVLWRWLLARIRELSDAVRGD
jgi:hypothetical protein